MRRKWHENIGAFSKFAPSLASHGWNRSRNGTSAWPGNTYLFFFARVDPPRRARVAPTPARDHFDSRSRWSCRRSSRKRRGTSSGKRLARRTKETLARRTDVDVAFDVITADCSPARAKLTAPTNTLSSWKAPEERKHAPAFFFYTGRSATTMEMATAVTTATTASGKATAGDIRVRDTRWQGRRLEDEVKSPRDTKRYWRIEDLGTGRLLAGYYDDNDGRERAIGLVAGRLCRPLGQSQRSAAKVATGGAKFNLQMRTTRRICSNLCNARYISHLLYCVHEINCTAVNLKVKLHPL